MNIDDLQIDRWNNLSECARYNLAQELTNKLAPSFQFSEIRFYEMGNQRHHIAFYDYKGSQFALILGSTAVLGFDANNFFPTPQQLESWNETAEEYMITGSLNEYIIGTTTPIRKVRINPFLLEVAATEVGIESVSINEKGEVISTSLGTRSHHEIAKKIAKDNFRFPTSDEWEYACQAGTRTLFRWGNDCPANCYPGDDRCEDFFNQQPNAFGLHIAQNPYELEFVSDPKIMRGGDGGGIMCGGAGFFVAWLTLASSYIDKYTIHSEDDFENKERYGSHLRRAFSLL
jgi:hypothetical protein